MLEYFRIERKNNYNTDNILVENCNNYNKALDGLGIYLIDEEGLLESLKDKVFYNQWFNAYNQNKMTGVARLCKLNNISSLTEAFLKEIGSIQEFINQANLNDNYNNINYTTDNIEEESDEEDITNLIYNTHSSMKEYSKQQEPKSMIEETIIKQEPVEEVVIIKDEVEKPQKSKKGFSKLLNENEEKTKREKENQGDKENVGKGNILNINILYFSKDNDNILTLDNFIEESEKDSKEEEKIIIMKKELEELFNNSFNDIKLEISNLAFKLGIPLIKEEDILDKKTIIEISQSLQGLRPEKIQIALCNTLNTLETVNELRSATLLLAKLYDNI